MNDCNINNSKQNSLIRSLDKQITKIEASLEDSWNTSLPVEPPAEDDDWMSESLDKYKHLFKYNMENSPLKIRIHPNGKQILLLSVTPRQKYEILVFKLPGKVLATSPKEEGLINNRELSLLCGCIESRTVLDCDFAPNEICAVLVLTPGKVDVLNRKDEASDLLVKTETFSMDKPGTQLKVAKEKIFVIGQQVLTT